jgi:hypothetical protein
MHSNVTKSMMKPPLLLLKSSLKRVQCLEQPALRFGIAIKQQNSLRNRTCKWAFTWLRRRSRALLFNLLLEELEPGFERQLFGALNVLNIRVQILRRGGLGGWNGGRQGLGPLQGVGQRPRKQRRFLESIRRHFEK